MWMFYHSASDDVAWTIYHVKLAQSTAFHFPWLLPALHNLWLFLVFNNILISLTLYFHLYIKDKSAELRKKGEKNEKAYSINKIVSNLTETVHFVPKRFFRKTRMSFWFSAKESDSRYDSLCRSIQCTPEHSRVYAFVTQQLTLRATCKRM